MKKEPNEEAEKIMKNSRYGKLNPIKYININKLRKI